MAQDGKQQSHLHVTAARRVCSGAWGGLTPGLQYFSALAVDARSSLRVVCPSTSGSPETKHCRVQKPCVTVERAGLIQCKNMWQVLRRVYSPNNEVCE